MATRFYFPDTQAAPVSPPAGGAEWEHKNNVTRSLVQTPDASALATTSYAPDAADDLTNRDSMHRQYVSERLAAQTISGNITGQFQILEDHANDNLFITIVAKVISEDGSTARATLLAIKRATSSEAGTTIANRTVPSTALTNYTCIDGDRLLIEVGLGGSITTATGGIQGHNGSIRWGCVASSGDLPVDETTTGTTYRPWIEFSGNLALDPVPVKAVGSSMAQLTGSSGMCGLQWK